eukprot:scaffold3651_cov230-Prasinococcus_capsulatus_cf.AAC.4
MCRPPPATYPANASAISPTWMIHHARRVQSNASWSTIAPERTKYLGNPIALDAGEEYDPGSDRADKNCWGAVGAERERGLVFPVLEVGNSVDWSRQLTISYAYTRKGPLAQQPLPSRAAGGPHGLCPRCILRCAFIGQAAKQANDIAASRFGV